MDKKDDRKDKFYYLKWWAFLVLIITIIFLLIKYIYIDDYRDYMYIKTLKSCEYSDLNGMPSGMPPPLFNFR